MNQILDALGWDAHPKPSPRERPARSVRPVAAVRLGLGFHRKVLPDFNVVNRGGNVQALARVLFGPYFFPFEATSVLLIVAAIGAMLHGRRRIAKEETIDFPTGAGAVRPRPAHEETITP